MKIILNNNEFTANDCSISLEIEEIEHDDGSKTIGQQKWLPINLYFNSPYEILNFLKNYYESNDKNLKIHRIYHPIDKPEVEGFCAIMELSNINLKKLMFDMHGDILGLEIHYETARCINI